MEGVRVPDLIRGQQFDFTAEPPPEFGTVEIDVDCRIVGHQDCVPNYFEPSTPVDGSRSLMEFVHVEDIQVAQDWVEDMLRDRIGVQRVRLRLGRPGQRRWVDMFGRFDETGEFTKSVISIADVDTELKAHESLARSEERFRKLYDSLEVGIFVFDRFGNCTYANEAFRSLMNWPGGYKSESDIPEVHLPIIEIITEKIESGADELSEQFVIERNGAEQYVEIRLQVIRREGAVVETVGYSVDLTQEVELRKAVEVQANTDLLTGLANRNRIQSLVDELLSRDDGPVVGLLFVDIDNFKRINDALGRWTGDQVLVEVAERIARVVPEDAVVGRLGGDEFVIVLDNLTLGSAYTIAQRLVEVARAPLVDARSGIQAQLSVGIALSDPSNPKPENLLRLADAAIFTAKRTGTSIAHADDDVRSQYERRSILTTSVSEAIRDSKLRLDYQAFLSFGEEPEVLGFEGLVRWKHAVLGEVSPSEIIPLTTEQSLVGPFTSWVIHQALNDAANLRSKYKDLSDSFITVNLSNRQLMLPDFLDVFDSAVGLAGVEHDAIAIEVTETQYIEVGSLAEFHLSELNRNGVVLMLDDFGAGHSSLEYLSRVPFSWIKLDRGIVANLTRSPQTRRLVGAMVRACRDFGTEVIAEGLETSADLEAVQDIGIRFGQGYLFGRPAQLGVSIKTAMTHTKTPL